MLLDLKDMSTKDIGELLIKLSLNRDGYDKNVPEYVAVDMSGVCYAYTGVRPVDHDIDTDVVDDSGEWIADVGGSAIRLELEIGVREDWRDLLFELPSVKFT